MADTLSHGNGTAKPSKYFTSFLRSRNHKDDVYRRPSPTTATNQPLTHYHSYFFDLLSWKNPRASASVYIGIIFLILAARYLDVVRYFFKLTWVALGTSVALEVVGKVLLGQGITSQLRPKKYHVVSRETLDALIGDVHELINFFVIEAQRILFVENITASAAALIAAFVSYYLVKVVPYWGLAIIGTTATFMIPLVYTSNQELIDAQLKHASEVVNAQTAQVRSAAKEHTAHVAELTKQYMGDYSAKAQGLIRGRSASPEVHPIRAAPSAPTTVPVPALTDADFPVAPSSTLDEKKGKEPEEADGHPADAAPAESAKPASSDEPLVSL